MPRYYFDLNSPTFRSVDDFGDLLASDDLALEYALSVLSETMRGKPAPCGTNLVVTVRDDTGPRFQAQASISVGAIDAPLSLNVNSRRDASSTPIEAGLDPRPMSKDMDCTSLAPRDPG